MEYHQSVIEDGVIVSKAIIDTSWTGTYKWQDAGIPIDRRRYRICAPGGVACIGGGS